MSSERELVRLAAALGAEACGGPLSVDERTCLDDSGSLPPPATTLVDQARAAILAGGDPLGDWFCHLRPAPTRRGLGAFYTAPALVDAMLDWLLRFSLDTIVDPGCGSGRFASAAARRCPNLALVAVDVDPLATLMTRATLAVVGAQAARVIHGDYLTLNDWPRSGRTGFIGNPPYVRHHDLSPTVKQWAAIAGIRADVPISALAGLHTLFYLATALQARPGDVGCFITSAEWLDTGYGKTIRRLLTERLGLRVLSVIDPRATPFADAMTTAAITGFEVGARPERVAVRVIDTPNALSLATIETTRERAELAQADRWSPLLRHSPASTTHDRDARPATVPLGTIVRVHRGVATGSNDFFVLTRARAMELGLLPWCRPVITRAQEVLTAGGIVQDTPERSLLLVVPPNVDRAAHPALDAYLRRGEPEVARRYLPSHRHPWWSLGPLTPPPIMASYMARQAPAFAANPDGLLLLNIAHGLYPHRPLSEAEITRFVARLNAGRDAFRGHGRTYQGGLEKFEPREMEALPIRVEAIIDAALRPTAPADIMPLLEAS